MIKGSDAESIVVEITWTQGGSMSTIQTAETPRKQGQNQRRKLQFTMPQIRSLGNITRRTQQGGSSEEYDSYSDNRS
jgi:hypothetical protein